MAGFSWGRFFAGVGMVAIGVLTAQPMLVGTGLTFIASSIPKPSMEQRREGALVQGVSTQNAIRLCYGKVRLAAHIVFMAAKHFGAGHLLTTVGVLCLGNRESQAGEAVDPFGGAIQGGGPVWANDVEIFGQYPAAVGAGDTTWTLQPTSITHRIQDSDPYIPDPAYSGRYMVHGKLYLGRHDQEASTEMLDTGLMGYGDDEDWPWDDTMRLRGLAYYVFRHWRRAGSSPASIPNYTLLVKGARLYDPRTGNWTGGLLLAGQNDNAALVLRDYLLHRKSGGSVDIAQIDEVTFSAVADRSDEFVTLDLVPPVSRRRHTLNGAVDTSRSVKANVQDMLRCFSAHLDFQEGKFRLRQRLDTAEPVDLILDESNIVGDWSFGTTGIEGRANLIIGNYVDTTIVPSDEDAEPELKDQVMQAQYPPVGEDNPYLAADGGLEIPREIDLPFINSEHEAREICRQELLMTRNTVTASLTAHEPATLLSICDRVRIHHPRPDWNMKHFWVEVLGLLPDRHVRVAVREVEHGADYGFPVIGPIVGSDYPTLSFAEFCEIVHGHDIGTSNSSTTTGLDVSWDAVPPEDADHTQYKIQIRSGPCSNFDPMSGSPDPGFDCGFNRQYFVDADAPGAEPYHDAYSSAVIGAVCSNKRCSTTLLAAARFYKARWSWRDAGSIERYGPWSPTQAPPPPATIEDNPEWYAYPYFCTID